MPIYEYVCSECGLKFELLRSMNQADQGAPCPRCKNGARRVLSSFAAFSRGSGGESAPVGGGSACSTCTATDCSSCH
ncbi:MAG TPA: zinc ribbon domain-containing protein [Dehalococcoidia bacterium]|nr:zinc ribbon domain-containing protein [Dehalococcoidia bacterium]